MNRRDQMPSSAAVLGFMLLFFIVICAGIYAAKHVGSNGALFVAVVVCALMVRALFKSEDSPTRRSRSD